MTNSDRIDIKQKTNFFYCDGLKCIFLLGKMEISENGFFKYMYLNGYKLYGDVEKNFKLYIYIYIHK